MTGLEYAAWGLFGGFAVEGLEFSTAIRRNKGWPWQNDNGIGPLPLLISVIIRLGIGSGLATAAGLSDQVSGPFGALAVGIAAPLLVEQLARQIPLNPTPPPETPPTGQPPAAPAEPPMPVEPAAGADSRMAATGGDHAS
ncbi:hypothetical protein [Goodfellowiella coeruleoviolacea]|uniref:Uncharacterized protein n=1 Tax=Goodfellowiella coeruleoviolacea TaxID=334858 RepID=A0AAE3GAI3_9PSEU|nr:hypothetical protein [Goodfellowiella coeruleoviolacea]MCP2164223.1 hypothetical protein [Goodfellowiella coeruleoviolacea]